MPPWKKRRADSAVGTSTASGSQHSTGTASLFVADVGKYHEESVVKDKCPQDLDESAWEEIQALYAFYRMSGNMLDAYHLGR